MILASHQPDFAPYPGFWYKLFRSDVFVLSDDVAYSNSEMHKYNYIRSGDARMRIGMPVQAHADGTPLWEVRLSKDDRLIFKAVKTFDQTYKNAPFFNQYGWEFRNILLSAACRPEERLYEITAAIFYWMLEGFGWQKKVVRASDLRPQGRRDDRIIDICEKLGCTTYLSGWGAANYHKPELYDQHGIKLIYTDYKTLEYEQFQGGFVKDCSMIDYIMNHGFKTPDEWRWF